MADSESGEGDNDITFAHNAGTADMDITAGAGNDTVTMTGAAAAKRSKENGEGVTVNGSLNVNAGDGDNTISLDAVLANGYSAAQVIAGTGYDVLMLTGQLNSSDDNPLSGTLTKTDESYSGQIRMVASGMDKDFKVSVTSFEFMQDTLEGKPTVKLNKLSGTEIKSFTNYTYEYTKQTNPNTGNEIPVSADWTGFTVLLTNLIITGPSVLLGNINIPTVNLTVNAQKVTVDGTIDAASITIKATDSDVLFDLGGMTGGIGGEALSGSLFDFVATAEIKLTENAKIKAESGAVTMTASTDQTKNIIDLLGPVSDSLNCFNVKVGTAFIGLAGEIVSKASTIISAAANVLLEVSNEMLAKLFVPLAFIVTVTEAAVEINDAKITSGSHLKVNTESTVGIKTTATTGKLPVALSVAVAVNDSHITVGGKSNIKAEGDIELISKAVTAADAKASRGNAATNRRRHSRQFHTK